ncbi:MAG: hypothetical protein ACYS8W_03235 [Planctomycetota bacterium]|jgi:hypothetical protein
MAIRKTEVSGIVALIVIGLAVFGVSKCYDSPGPDPKRVRHYEAQAHKSVAKKRNLAEEKKKLENNAKAMEAIEPWIVELKKNEVIIREDHLRRKIWIDEGTWQLLDAEKKEEMVGILALYMGGGEKKPVKVCGGHSGKVIAEWDPWQGGAVIK